MTFNISTFKKTLKSAFSNLEKDQSEALAVEISSNFVAGQTAAEKHKSMEHNLTMEDLRLNYGTYFTSEDQDTMEDDDGLTDEEKAEIATLTALYLGYISEFNSRAQAQILARVQELVKAGSSQDEIKQYVDSVFSGEESIVIDNVGKERKEIYVDKNLKLSEVTRTVEKPFYSSVLAYASLIGAIASHKAYEKGKELYYREQGFKSWVFVGPSDERARAWHVALLGITFTWGTIQSNYAEQCLHEPRCRHRAIPFFNDSRDTKKEVWDKLKEDAGLFWDVDKKEWSLK